MPFIVWIFLLSFLAGGFAILQVLLIAIPNAISLKKNLQIYRPERIKTLQISPEKLLKESPLRITKHYLQYWFNNEDCDIPAAAKHKNKVKNTLIRVFISFFIVILCIFICGIWILFK